MTEEYTNKTEQINAALSEAQGQATRAYHEYLDGLKDVGPELEDKGRTDRAWDAHAKTQQALSGAVEKANERLSERERELQARLFGRPRGAADAEAFDAALARATMAADEQLAAFGRMAHRTGSRQLSRAVAAVAHERGRPEILNEHLQASPEEAPYFEELNTIPSAERREKVARNTQGVLPTPTWEQVKPTQQAIARARSYRPLAGA